jgi:NOL1/NOP2/fmu family ribosome biogenesis protein
LDAFDAYHVLERHHGYVVLPQSARVENIASFKVQNTGLPILRKMPHHLKPTTAALQRFGHYATRHVVELTPAEMIVLLREQETRVEMSLQPGYVLFRCEGHLLGCGIYTPGRLRSLIPLRQVKHQHLPESIPPGH